MALMELVPNVSEGRDRARLTRLVQAFRGAGVHLLDVDASRAANRAVITLCGPPAALVDAAVRGARVAAAEIDLRQHRGVHPRMGALDVCPFVSLDGDPAAAVAAATEAARRIGAIGVPAYLYGDAARRPEHKLLHRIRGDGFEGLAARMANDPADFGPGQPHATAGATAVGARFFLVAFNVNLDTDDPAVAKRIAARIRARRRAGDLPHVRAIGWVVEDFGCAQVSTNLTDYRVTPPHVLLAAVREEAAADAVSVTGTELVGCVPLDALRAAALADGMRPGDPDRRLVERAALVLGLNAAKPFDPDRKVVEWAVERTRRGEYDTWEEVLPC